MSFDANRERLMEEFTGAIEAAILASNCLNYHGNVSIYRTCVYMSRGGTNFWFLRKRV